MGAFPHNPAHGPASYRLSFAIGQHCEAVFVGYECGGVFVSHDREALFVSHDREAVDELLRGGKYRYIQFVGAQTAECAYAARRRYWRCSGDRGGQPDQWGESVRRDASFSFGRGRFWRIEAAFDYYQCRRLAGISKTQAPRYRGLRRCQGVVQVMQRDWRFAGRTRGGAQRSEFAEGYQLARVDS